MDEIVELAAILIFSLTVYLVLVPVGAILIAPVVLWRARRRPGGFRENVAASYARFLRGWREGLGDWLIGFS